MKFFEARLTKQIAVLVLIAGFLAWTGYPVTISADATKPLRPLADGGDDSASWDNGTITTCNNTECYLEVDEDKGSTCTDSDGDTSYIRSRVNGANQTFDIDESSIPDNANITQIVITTCDRRGAAGAQIQTRMCVDKTCTNSGKDIVLDASYAEHSQAYDVHLIKTDKTDIEIGVSNTAARAARVSQISAVITYIPPDTTAPAAVTNLAASHATGSSIDLSWTAPGDDGTSGTASSYDVRYSTSTITEGNWASATQAAGEPTPHVAGSSESMTVSSLDSDTTYYFGLKISDEVPNVSGLSNVPSLATLDITAPVISNISSGTPGETSATITWTTDEAATSQVEYGETAGYGSQTTLDASLVTAHSVAITGLTRSTGYHFRVKSQDASNNEAVSGDDSFTTIVLPDPVISNISSSNITQTTAVITWATDIASTSQILYGTTAGNHTESTVPDANLVTSHSVSLSGLTAATVYYYVVKSVDAGSHTATSPEYFFTTLDNAAPPDTVPPDIYGIVVLGITQTAAKITWTTDEAATSQVEYGLTTDYGSSSTLDSAVVTAHSVALAGLERKTLYHFRVKSKDAAGNERISGDQNFTTTPGEEPSPGPNDTTPPVVSDLAAGSITDSQATITWVTDEAATSRVFYGTASGNYSDSTSENVTKLQSHSVVIHGLAPSTIYYYIVKSKDAAGNEAVSGEKSFTTVASAPAAPGAPGTTEPAAAPGATGTKKEILPTQGDTTPPLVTLGKIIPNPTDNQKPTITGTATDKDGVIASLSVSLNDGQSWHPVTIVAGLGTHEVVFTYIPMLLEDGNFSVKARARDNSGNEGFSETQTLIIDVLSPIFGGKSIMMGNQPAAISEDGIVSSMVGLSQKIIISAKGGPTVMTVTAQSQNSNGQNQVFDLQYAEAADLWTGDLIFASSGVFDITLTATDGAGHTITQVLNTFAVQPAGGVLEEKTGQQVAQVRASLYQRDPATHQWALWPAEAFGQHNPQITGTNGGYQFFVPSGQYYLKVVKEGYRPMVSQIVTLDMPRSISSDIFLAKEPSLHLGSINITLPSWFIFAKSETVSPPTSVQESSGHIFNKFIGKAALEFTLADSNGGQNRLLDQRGKKVVISVWNTWDSKSQEQLAVLEKVAQEKGISTVVFPLVLQESPSKVQTYLKRGGYSIASLVDPTGVFTASWPVVSVPQHFFIDRKGILRDMYVGFLDEASLMQKIDNL